MESRIILLLLSSLLAFGCVDTGFNAVDVAKQSAQLQPFLSAHPGSSISVVLLSYDQARSALGQYPACASVVPQSMYFVTFQDQSQSAIAFVNASPQTLLCAVVNHSTFSPSPTVNPSVSTTPLPQASLCPGGFYYCPDGSTCSASSSSSWNGGFVCIAPYDSWVTCSPGRVCPQGNSCQPYWSKRACGPAFACPLYLCVPSVSPSPTSNPPANFHIQTLEACFPAPFAGGFGNVTLSMNDSTPVRFNPEVSALSAAAQLNAVCSNGQLLDSSGKPILYYKSMCFGAEPTQETLKKIAAFVNQLKQQYALIDVQWQYMCQ